MNPTHIEHIGIAVTSLEESIPFFENLLGTKCYAIEEVEFKVSALVSNCGAVDFGRLIDNKFLGIKYMINAFTGFSHKEIRANLDKDEIKILSPEVKEGFPPTMLIYAKNDFLKTESFALQKRFDEIGTPYRMHCAEGILSMHAFPLATIEKRGKACLDDTVDFISQYAK